jgi:hypothetical protein
MGNARYRISTLRQQSATFGYSQLQQVCAEGDLESGAEFPTDLEACQAARFYSRVRPRGRDSRRWPGASVSVLRGGASARALNDQCYVPVPLSKMDFAPPTPEVICNSAVLAPCDEGLNLTDTLHCSPAAS